MALLLVTTTTMYLNEFVVILNGECKYDDVLADMETVHSFKNLTYIWNLTVIFQRDIILQIVSMGFVTYKSRSSAYKTLFSTPYLWIPL